VNHKFHSHCMCHVPHFVTAGCLKIFQASLSLPGSPFNLRRGSRGSHQFTIRNGRGRFVGPPGGDRKPLVLSTYLDAQVRSFIGSLELLGLNEYFLSFRSYIAS